MLKCLNWYQVAWPRVSCKKMSKEPSAKQIYDHSDTKLSFTHLLAVTPEQGVVFATTNNFNVDKKRFGFLKK